MCFNLTLSDDEDGQEEVGWLVALLVAEPWQLETFTVPLSPMCFDQTAFASLEPLSSFSL